MLIGGVGNGKRDMECWVENVKGVESEVMVWISSLFKA